MVYIGPEHIYSNYCMTNQSLMAKKRLLGDNSYVESYTTKQLVEIINKLDKIYLIEAYSPVAEYEIAFENIIKLTPNAVYKVMPLYDSKFDLGYDPIQVELDQDLVGRMMELVGSLDYKEDLKNALQIKSILYSFYRIYKDIDKDKVLEEFKKQENMALKLPKSTIDRYENSRVIDSRLDKILQIEDRFKQVKIKFDIYFSNRVMANILEDTNYRAFPLEVQYFKDRSNRKSVTLTILSEQDFDLHYYRDKLLWSYYTLINTAI